MCPIIRLKPVDHDILGRPPELSPMSEPALLQEASLEDLQETTPTTLPATRPLQDAPCLQRLNQNDISKIAKLLMDAVNNEEDTEAVETAVEHAEGERDTREQQNSIGMQYISCMRRTYT